MTDPIPPLKTSRATLFERLSETFQYDVAVIGGGATGVGVALESVARGYSTVLVEANDFAKCTSSRSTKLVHGGVRYLAQGNFALVREALRERKSFFHNAPHLAQPLPFVVPAYKTFDLALYGIGLSLYDAIAGRATVGRTRMLNKSKVKMAAPTLRDDGLCGGVRYWDGQFDDARMTLAVARSAALRGALVLNYCPVTELLESAGKLYGIRCNDSESGHEYEIHAKCIVNATGVWSGDIKKLGDGNPLEEDYTVVRPSQGAHLVVDRSFWPSNDALLVPKTADGRVLFAIPWLGSTLLGTTDTPQANAPCEPVPAKEEVDFILREISAYLKKPPVHTDVKSVWAGLRPLASQPGQSHKATSSVSREHTIEVSRTGLVSVTGGKWTTYRLMAEQVLSSAVKAGLLREQAGNTIDMPLVGAENGLPTSISAPPGYHLYGNEHAVVKALPGADRTLALGLTEAMVRFAARFEYARTVEDVLARRSRILFLDAVTARRLAEPVGKILEEELGIDPKVDAFITLCSQYLPVEAGDM